MVFFLVLFLLNIFVFDFNIKGVGRIGKVFFSLEDFGRGFFLDFDWVFRVCILKDLGIFFFVVKIIFFWIILIGLVWMFLIIFIWIFWELFLVLIEWFIVNKLLDCFVLIVVCFFLLFRIKVLDCILFFVLFFSFFLKILLFEVEILNMFFFKYSKLVVFVIRFL